MSLLIWMTASSVADTWGPVNVGFVSQPRGDAPTDAVLVYEANHEVMATVTVGPGAPTALEVALRTGVGAPPRLLIRPPAGDWVAGETYTVTTTDTYYGDQTHELTFTVADAVAADAVAPETGEPVVSQWSEPDNYPWGCCEPTRTVEVDVDLPHQDAWGWVELIGAFDLDHPSQITAQEIHGHLDLQLGDGPLVLEFLQWQEDGQPQPPCFDVVSFSAAGVAGPGVPFCSDADGVEIQEPAAAERARGCSTSPGTTTGWFGDLLVSVARRRPQD